MTFEEYLLLYPFLFLSLIGVCVIGLLFISKVAKPLFNYLKSINLLGS